MANRICMLCFDDTPPKSRLCKKCATKCVRCRKKPKASGQSYCKRCAADYRKYLRTISYSPEKRAAEILRKRINTQIREGKLERLPCWCGEQKSFLFITDAAAGTYGFLCRVHHDEATDRHGRIAKERGDEALPPDVYREKVKRELALLAGWRQSLRDPGSLREVEDAGCDLDGRSDSGSCRQSEAA